MMKRQSEHWEKVKRKAEDKEIEEMQECTFFPQFSNNEQSRISASFMIKPVGHSMSHQTSAINYNFNH